MAYYTQAQFAKLVGLTPAHISTYKKRGKITMSGEVIDDEIPQNAYFIKKQLEKKKSKMLNEIPKNETPVIPDPITGSLTAPIIEKPQTNFLLDTRLKELNAIKIEQEIEATKIKNQKLLGELIPVELVKIIFAQHAKSIVTEFKAEIEKFLVVFGKKRNLTRSEIVEIRIEFTDTINSAVKNAVEESRKNIQNIQDEYSEKRGPGEKK